MSNVYYSPTQMTAPVADTTAGLFTFTTPVSHLFVGNYSGQPIYIRFNADEAAVATHDYYLANNGVRTFPAADYGLRNFTTVSVWFPSGATVGNFEIRGA